MPKKQKRFGGMWQIVAVLTGILGFLGILGELEITSIGRAIYAGFTAVFGSFAWGVPLIFLLVAIVIVVKLDRANQSRLGKSGSRLLLKDEYTKGTKRKPVQERKSKKSISFLEEKKGVPLPKGKLVSLQGFNEYFASNEGPDIESAAAKEPLTELGRDFTTYFQEGQEFSFQPLGTQFKAVQPLKGFPTYFEHVQSEYEQELHNSSVIPERRVPGQLAQLVQYQPQYPVQQQSSIDEIPIQKEKEPVQEQEKAFPTATHSEAVSRASDIEIQITEPPKYDCQPSNVKEDLESSTSDFEVNSSCEEVIEEVIEDDKSKNEVAPCEIETVEEIRTEVPDEVEEVPETSQLARQKFWVLPEFEILDPLPNIPVVYDPETQKKLEQVLADFGVQAKVIRVTRGPVITRFELAPAPGVKISRIVHLADDIALGLAARDVRIEAPIPGKAAIGIEVPNKQPRPVPFREVLETSAFKESFSKLKTALGKDIANQTVIADLAKMPHVLIAGATGSGKSVCITTIINSILFNAQPSEVKFLMVDPKMVELSIYNGIPHLLAPVVTDPKKAAAALKWIVKEMETRYELFAAAGVRDIGRYNRQKASPDKVAPALPWIVVIIDELADLMMVAANDVEEAICRLAQMARAAGIHLVIATQRPSVDVITGVIKANIPSRISFAVSSQIDSRTILDATGAEKLLGRGDMLYSPQGLNKPIRVQGCYVSDDEVQRTIDYWKSQGKPEYLAPEGFFIETDPKTDSAGPDDELFIDAGRMIMNTGMASVSFLQRKFKLGYARAARLMDLLEDNGVVGGYEGSKPRQILMTKEEFDERFG